jgi:hypothetical protein
MSFRSIEQLLRRNSKTKISRNIVDGVHDQKEERCVQSLRELLLASNQLPEKFDDYYLLLRYAHFFYFVENYLRIRGVLFFHTRRMPVSFQFCTEDGLDLITLFHYAAF